MAVPPKVRKLLGLLAAGELRLVARKLARLTYSDASSVGLRRDLDAPFRVPRTGLPARVRPLRAGDATPFLDPHAATEDVDPAVVLRSHLATCYVAEDDAGRPCCMAYLIDHTQNSEMRTVFRGDIPELAHDEVVMESMLCLPEVRGRGYAMHLIPALGQAARDLGARHIITFVGPHNQLMLRMLRFYGFVPYMTRQESYRLFRRRITFVPLASAVDQPRFQLRGDVQRN